MTLSEKEESLLEAAHAFAQAVAVLSEEVTLETLRDHEKKHRKLIGAAAALVASNIELMQKLEERGIAREVAVRYPFFKVT